MRNRTRSALRRLPLLADLPPAAVQRVEGLMTSVRVPAGEVLVRQGARNRQFVLVEQGTVQVTRDGQEVAQLGPGEFAGELSLLGDGTATATVTTLTDVVARISSRAEFDALLHSALGGRIQAAATDRQVA